MAEACSKFLPFYPYYYHALRQEINILTGDMEAFLLLNSYAPDLKAHNAWDDVSAYECADGDYAKQDVDTPTISQAASGLITIDAPDFDFGDTVTISAAYAGMRLNSGTPATSYLLGLYILRSHDLLGGLYKFTQSPAQNTEYYLELQAGGDPGIDEPSQVIEDGVAMTVGTVGALAAGEWDWGDNDTLGYSTVYLRLSGGDNDPDGVSDLSLLTCQGNLSSTNSQFDVANHANGLLTLDPLRS